MKKFCFFLLLSCLLVFICGTAYCQNPKQDGKQYLIMIDTYKLDNSEDAVNYDRLNEMISEKYDVLSGNKRFVQTAIAAYKTSFSGIVTKTVDGLLGMGFSYISNSVRSHKNDWRKAIMKECSFTKKLKMGQDASDFYSTVSNVGALDLRGIAFKGFSCRNIQIQGSDTVDVVYISCKLDTSKAGVDKLMMQSKFQVVVDSVMFNTRICDIPNDSVMRAEDRIPFDFDRRKNLTVKLNTTVKSSWMNEGIQIVVDKELGEFAVEINIDPKNIDKETGIFTYSRRLSPNSEFIKVSGESFIVPRSYIGVVENGGDMESCWGTGHYKLEMQLSETCQINESFYLKKGTDPKKHKMNSEWRKEWKIIKNREKKGLASPWQSYSDQIKSEYRDGKWVTIITNPVKSALMEKGSELLDVKASPSTGTGSEVKGQKLPEGGMKR